MTSARRRYRSNVDPSAITARLDDHDKVRSNAEAIDFKKSLDRKFPLRMKREMVKDFSLTILK